MVADLAIYTVIHQPRRLKLPAQPIPRGASVEDITRCLFDEQMNERYFHKVAKYCYYPATHMFLDLVRQQGLRLSIGFSLSFIRQAMAWDRPLLDLFRELVAEENVELIGVEPYHSFLFLLDLSAFVQRMQEMVDELERIFGKRPVVTDTTEMCMSASLYSALDTAGFRGALLDGRGWVMGWREPAHLYRSGDNGPFAQPLRSAGRSRRLLQRAAPEQENSPYLLARHLDLSDDVGYRFSNRTWPGYPLYADTYAHWLAESRGDFVFLGWDYETFGEHHRMDSGIFEFMRALPNELAKRNVATFTASEIIERHSHHTYHLPLPAFPTTWAGSGGMEFFLGNSAQQAILQLMGHVYGVARLTENPELVDLAIWLAQSDNLHLIQWFGRSGPEAEVSAYFTPQEWWALGPNGVIREQQQVYINALHAMEPYLPVRLQRQAASQRSLRSRMLKQAHEMALSHAAWQAHA
ncbi:MAG: glycoside hydrolase [Ktedonobacteraceae bacterium]|nr:glycoside hydrolase [Ktedonobacteraceae bacterium]